MTLKQRQQGSAAVPRLHIEFFVGDLVVIINPPYVHLAVARTSPRTRQRLGPPRFFGGQRAQHLTIPLEPLSYGRDAGKFNIHLTYLAKPEPYRYPVVRLTPEEIEAKFRPLAAALLAHYARVVRQVTVEALRADGFVVIVPRENAPTWVDRKLNERRRWKIHVDDATIMRFAENFEFYDAAVLDDLAEESEDERDSVMLVNERDGAMFGLIYRPDGLGPDHPPGWYASPVNADFRTLIEEVFMVGLGPAFYERLIDVARELEAEVDLDAIERALARARDHRHAQHRADNVVPDASRPQVAPR
jgi:hypothetical protein